VNEGIKIKFALTAFSGMTIFQWHSFGILGKKRTDGWT